MIKTKESRKYVFNEKTRRANDASVKRSFGGNVPVSDFYQTRVIYDETKKKEKEDEKFVIEKLSRGPTIWRQKNLFPFFLHSQVLTFGHLLRDIHTLEQ